MRYWHKESLIEVQLFIQHALRLDNPRADTHFHENVVRIRKVADLVHMNHHFAPRIPIRLIHREHVDWVNLCKLLDSRLDVVEQHLRILWVSVLRIKHEWMCHVQGVAVVVVSEQQHINPTDFCAAVLVLGAYVTLSLAACHFVDYVAVTEGLGAD